MKALMDAVWGDSMVEIEVSVADGTRVHGLMRRLRGVFDSAEVAYDSARKHVRVRAEWESRAVVEVVGVGHEVAGGSSVAVGRPAAPARFPGSRWWASWARPRAMRDRTVPGGIPRTSAISA